MRHSDARRLGTLPNASGTLTRLAYAHAKEGGIDLRPLLRQANLTPASNQEYEPAARRP